WVTLSLYYQEKKYSFWPAAAPAQTASSYIPEPPPKLRGRPLKLSIFYKYTYGHLLKMINYFRLAKGETHKRKKKHRVKSKRGKE
ncbi:MAG: hypothetical protein O4859_17325, partial [Trichodesmium sp. St18_bin1]|nr:hypothetical protein [Trichodesmium sp. St18_bin1]